MGKSKGLWEETGLLTQALGAVFFSTWTSHSSISSVLSLGPEQPDCAW